MSREIMLLTAYFEHSVGLSSDINANLMHDVCFSRETEDTHYLGRGFHFPPGLWQDSFLHGGSLWIQKLGASVVTPVGSTHTRAELAGVRSLTSWICGVSAHTASNIKM